MYTDAWSDARHTCLGMSLGGSESNYIEGLGTAGFR